MHMHGRVPRDPGRRALVAEDLAESQRFETEWSQGLTRNELDTLRDGAPPGRRVLPRGRLGRRRRCRGGVLDHDERPRHSAQLNDRVERLWSRGRFQRPL